MSVLVTVAIPTYPGVATLFYGLVQNYWVAFGATHLSELLWQSWLMDSVLPKLPECVEQLSDWLASTCILALLVWLLLSYLKMDL